MWPSRFHQRTVASVQERTRRTLRRDWLNDQTASSDLPAVAAHTDTIFQGKRITVAHPGPQYLLATKIVAGRQKDIDDAAALIAATGPYTGVDDLCRLVAEVYGTPNPRPGVNVRENAEQALGCS